jgi:hypothetical protein
LIDPRLQHRGVLPHVQVPVVPLNAELPEAQSKVERAKLIGSQRHVLGERPAASSSSPNRVRSTAAS